MGLFASLRGIFTRKTPITKPAGSDGVYAPMGYLFGGERKADLQGDQKWITYDNTIANCITVAGAVRVWVALHGSAEWEVEPNAAGGKDAEACADLVREGLLEAQMSRPWKRVVQKAGFGCTFKGFSMFEQIMRRRADGKIITADLQHRPQHTVKRWDKPDEQAPWGGVVQQTSSGREYYLERERLFYVVDDTIGDSPDGVGVLRHLAAHAARVERYEQLEGWGFEGDLRGIQFGYAPLAKLAREAGTTDPAKIKTYVDAQTKFFRDILEKGIKTPDFSVLLDSEPFADKTTGAPSALRQWVYELMKGGANGQDAVRRAIDSVNREMARVMCVEWMLMGDGEGARAVHTDKTDMFGLVLNSSLDNIGECATNGPARRMVALNGYDPDTCTPRVKAQPIPMETVEASCRALQLLAQAGAPIRPGDKAPDVLRKRAKLPPEPELPPELLMLPQPGAAGGRGTPRDPSPAGSPPDPSKGEVDVDLDDVDEKPKPKKRRKGRAA